VKLRDYQWDALRALDDARATRPEENRLAVVMATGLGKTITFADEAGLHLAVHGSRPLILTHTDELADQAVQKVQLLNPRRTVGLVKAGSDETDADIVIGSVQTLANPARRYRLTSVGLVIVDECHHATAGTYQNIIDYYGGMDGTPVTGYTATLERGDGKSLSPTFHDVVFTRGVSWAVRKGYLVQPRGYRVEIPDMVLRGSSDASVDTALVDSIAPARVVEAWIQHAANLCTECLEAVDSLPEGTVAMPNYCPNSECGVNRGHRPTVLFAPLVRSAGAFAEAFMRAGLIAKVVHGAMPADSRRATLAAYERGEIDVLCNAMVLTEGWDSPRTSCVIVARPTQSRPLFVQMAGRGLRRDPTLPTEDQDCVLLVVADSTTDLCSIADLSDKPIEPEDGKSILQLEDEYDLSRDLEPDPETHWAGEVVAREFDPLVARSGKVWGTTRSGTLFLQAGRRAHVFVGPDRAGWYVASTDGDRGRFAHRSLPDLELAMALAEDVAIDLGGDIGKLYADRTRAWRKGRPTADQIAEADRLGLAAEVDKIMATRGAGKAGKVSDLISRVKASRRIDPVVERIKQRTGQA
jgi:ATP-dependent helicase IRC3